MYVGVQEIKKKKEEKLEGASNLDVSKQVTNVTGTSL